MDELNEIMETYRNMSLEQLRHADALLEKEKNELRSISETFTEYEDSDDADDNDDRQHVIDRERKIITIRIEEKEQQNSSADHGTLTSESQQNAIQQQGQVNKKPRREPVSMIEEYLKALKKLKVAGPTCADLASVSDISSSKWQRHLSDAMFLLALKSQLKKKQSRKFSKKEETRDFWRLGEQAIDEWTNTRTLGNDALSKNRTVRYFDTKSYGHEESELGDSYDEELEH